MVCLSRLPKIPKFSRVSLPNQKERFPGLGIEVMYLKQLTINGGKPGKPNSLEKEPQETENLFV